MFDLNRLPSIASVTIGVGVASGTSVFIAASGSRKIRIKVLWVCLKAAGWMGVGDGTNMETPRYHFNAKGSVPIGSEFELAAGEAAYIHYNLDVASDGTVVAEVSYMYDYV